MAHIPSSEVKDSALWEHAQNDIEAATHENMSRPDWGANMEIMENMKNLMLVAPLHGHRILKHLKKRIVHKKDQVGYLALCLLESLVKNCPGFANFIANPEFLKAMVKSIPRSIRKPREKTSFYKKDRKNNTEISHQRIQKVLTLLKAWASQATANSTFKKTYQDLQQKVYSWSR